MAHFIGEIFGSARTPASRCGTENSGMVAHIRGWHIGVRVVLEHREGKDVVRVWLTDGSNGSRARVIYEGDDGPPKLKPEP